jgi:hypothetical protein
MYQNNPFQAPPSPVYPAQGMRRGNVLVKQMLIQETGSYHPIVHRPINPVMEHSTIEAIAGRAMESTAQGADITSGLLTGLVSRSFAPPSQHSGVVFIPNGWTQPRLRFLLEIEYTMSTGMRGSYHIQGYSDHPGVHYTGVGQALFDEHMPWIINSYIKSTEKSSWTPDGRIVTQMHVSESAHVIDDGFHIENHETGDVYRMRPQDIVTGLMSLDRANDASGTLFANGNPLNDPFQPIHHSNNTMKGGSVPSARANDMPTVYAAAILNSVAQGYNNMEIGQTPANALSTARARVYERPLAENVFIHSLGLATGRPCPTYFTLKELFAVDANSHNNINFVPLTPNDILKPHNVVGSDTCAWTENTNESVMATVLASSVPSLMLQNYMTTIGFLCTNDTPDRRMKFDLITTPIFLGAMDLRHLINSFAGRLEHEIMFDQSFGNEQTYAISFLGDVFGETRITVSIDHGPFTQYATPSFADAKLATVFTPNNMIYRNALTQFGEIIDCMRPAMQGSSPIYTGGI